MDRHTDSDRNPSYERPQFEILGTMESLTKSGIGTEKDTGKGLQVKLPTSPV